MPVNIHQAANTLAALRQETDHYVTMNEQGHERQDLTRIEEEVVNYYQRPRVSLDGYVRPPMAPCPTSPPRARPVASPQYLLANIFLVYILR